MHKIINFAIQRRQMQQFSCARAIPFRVQHHHKPLGYLQSQSTDHPAQLRTRAELLDNLFEEILIRAWQRQPRQLQSPNLLCATGVNVCLLASVSVPLGA